MVALISACASHLVFFAMCCDHTQAFSGSANYFVCPEVRVILRLCINHSRFKNPYGAFRVRLFHIKYSSD